MKTLFITLSLAVIFVGCRPEEEATQYTVTDRVALSADSPLENNICALAPDPDLSNTENIKACVDQQGCQAVYDNGGSNYIGCVPKETEQARGGEEEAEEEEKQGEGGSSSGGEEAAGGSSGGEEAAGGGSSSGGGEEMNKGGSSGGANGSEGESSSEGEAEQIQVEINEARCDEKGKKVFVCHTNNGSKKRKTICISINGWLNGHQQGHKSHREEDYLGACLSE